MLLAPFGAHNLHLGTSIGLQPFPATKQLRSSTCRSAQIEAMGGLDILVHSGATGNEGLHQADLASQFGWFMQLHVVSAAALMEACVPALVAARGAVVNVSAAQSIIPSPDFEAYSAAKAALDQVGCGERGVEETDGFVFCGVAKRRMGTSRRQILRSTAKMVLGQVG